MRDDLLPKSLNNPKRFDEIARRHLNAMRWHPQEYIPLGIIVNNPDYTRGLSYDQWLEPGPFFEAQAKILRDTLLVGSDYMPVLPLNHMGDVLIPTMFGAELFVPKAMAASLQDQGPTSLPVLGAIEEAERLSIPDMDAGMMPVFERIITSWRSWAPPWVDIITPFPMGAISLAQALRGSDFFADLALDPERCHGLLALCADVQIEVELYLRALIGERKSLPLSNFGIRSNGRRIGDDSIIMLSPDMISEFAVPYIERVARALGPTTLHFCTLSRRRADHVFKPRAESPLIPMARTQFGFEYYGAHYPELRGRLAVESFYGEAYRYICREHGSFRNWAFEFVPKYKSESGLILYFEVSSVDMGRELWAVWQEAHQLPA